jgi:class 3 adenylate cyclase
MVTAEVEAMGGHLVQFVGDGSLSTFDGPARAIRSAERLIEASRALGVETRAGLHTGECERRPNGIAGIAVHIAARVSAEASAGEVLVSRNRSRLGDGLGHRPAAIRSTRSQRTTLNVGALRRRRAHGAASSPGSESGSPRSRPSRAVRRAASAESAAGRKPDAPDGNARRTAALTEKAAVLRW